MNLIAVLRLQLKLLHQAAEGLLANPGRDFKTYRIAIVTTRQLALERAAQVGDVLFVDKQVTVAGDPKLMHGPHVHARKQVSHEALNHGGQQHQPIGVP